MASPTTVLLPFFNDDVIDVMANGSYWRLDGSRTVQYGISNGLDGERWPDAEGAASVLASALDNASSYCNINFSYKGVFSDPLQAYWKGADIILSLSNTKRFFDAPSEEAQGGFPYKALETYNGEAGDIFVNMKSQVYSYTDFDPGSYGYNVLLHELGHALGLKHPHDDGSTERPTFESLGFKKYDSLTYTVMTYNDKYSDQVKSYHPASYMILDVLALQALYGKNMSTNAGDSRHSLTNATVSQTIWDAGGNDTVDASQGTSAWTIELPHDRISTVVPEAIGQARPSSEMGSANPQTLYWLEGDIENVIGSRFSDRITGNDLTNGIKGGAGNDTIDGGDGIDYSVYSGTRATATITMQGGTVTVKSAEGTDTLTNVERLLFSDQLIALDWGGNAGQGYRLYQAAFARTPDVAGLSFWVDKLDGGTSLRDVAGGFVSSNEFGAAYGRSADAGRYVDKFYQNVLGRPGEPGGVAYWTGELLRGVSVAEILVSFSESSENVARLTPLVGQGIVLDFAAFS